MKIKTKIERILKSWDLILALLGAIVFCFLVDDLTPAIIVKDITSLSISTLAIIFSVFFAALAVMIASGDNEFIKFLESEGAYTELIWSYKYSFMIISIALLCSIILYVTTLYINTMEIPGVYPRIIMVPYVFITMYALFCTIASVNDAIKYAEYRMKFIILKNK